MRHVEFQLIDPDTGGRVPLPDVESWDLSPIRGSEGAVALTYPNTGLNFAALVEHVADDRDVRVAVRVDGIERPDLTAIISESSGDTAKPAVVWKFSGRFQAQLLDEVVTEPDTESDFGEVPDAEREFSTATAGEIVRTLALEAIVRGGLPGVDISSFGNTLDSNGVPWSKITTTTFAPGITLLDVLNTLTEQGLCEWHMAGLELGVYNPGTFGVDRTLQDPPIILHGPRDMEDAPRTHSVKDSATTVLASGAEGLYLFESDATALARRGRRIERYVSAGNIPDEGSLTAFAQASLERLAPGTLQITHGLAMHSGGPTPFDDFDLGDWVWSDTGQGLERLQVAQWSVSMSSSGVLSGTVTLNDLIASRAAQLDRKIKALADGVRVVGTSAPPPEEADSVAPAAPTGLVASSSAYTSAQGTTQAQISASWAEVTLNEDGSPCDDLSFYEVRWRYTDPDLFSGWQTAGSSSAGDESLSWSPVVPGTAVEWQVHAVDDNGNASDWSATDSLVTGADTTPPPVPSTPVVTPYLGQLKVVWGGLGSLGEVMPADFRHVQVHMSTTSGFTPSPVTLVDTLSTAGTSVLTGLAYGTEYFVRLVAVDTSANASAPSAQASGVPRTIGLDDIAFKDNGNLIEDGSFEDASVRYARVLQNGAGAAFSFTDTLPAQHGRWILEANATNAPGTLRVLYLSDMIEVVENQEFYLRFAARGTDGNGDTVLDNDGTLRVAALLYDNEQNYQRQVNVDVTDANASTAFQHYDTVIDTLTDVQNTAYMRIALILLSDNTAGTWFVDIVELRERLGTVLIQDLAVTNAKIDSLNVGKLTSGIMEAEVTVSGRIMTSLTGSRIEINNDGFFKYGPTDNVLVEISEDNVIITGSFQTKTTTSSRIEIGKGDARDSALFYDVNGNTTVFMGQSYDTGTGDPLSHGLFVRHTTLPTTFFWVQGSSENPASPPGFYLNKITDNGLGSNSTIRVQQGSPDHIYLRNNTTPGEYIFMGNVYNGATYEGQGLAGVNAAGSPYLRVSQTRMFWKGTQQGGDTTVLSLDATYAHFGHETGTGSALREGCTYYENGIGNYAGDEHHFTNDTGSAWASCLALSFLVQSGRAQKTAVRPLPVKAMDVVRDAPVSAWRYTDEAEDRVNVGPMAEDLPEWMRYAARSLPDDAPTERAGVRHPATSISLMSMIGTVMEAVRELDEELDDWRREKKRALPSRKKALRIEDPRE